MKDSKMVATRVLTLAKEDFKDEEMWEYVRFCLCVPKKRKSDVLDVALLEYGLKGRTIQKK